MLTPFESDHFGSMALVEIGALTVGSIRQSFRAGVPVAKGARKGFFELGGSTVVLLFRRGAIELDAALLDMTASGIETRLAMGSAIGRAARLPSPCEVRDAGR
jgi:phosphatidylserine decarboxylase